VLIGHVHAPRLGATTATFGLRVGKLEKQAVAFGDRVWFRSAGRIAPTAPRPFEKIPVRWERAYGGWDRSNPQPARHMVEKRNPVGVGARPSRTFEDGLRLPNIEDPKSPLRQLGDAPAPVGFGFVSPHWEPRASYAGTYDERWRKERAPLLPKNFDRRHLNAAPPGQVADGYLRGDEPVLAVGVAADGPLSFTLPGVPPPSVVVRLHSDADQTLTTNLDTVIIDSDERRLQLLWRTHLVLPRGPLEVAGIEVQKGPVA
jgi:hypothetical protein